MQQSVLEDFPQANISVSIVWIDMLPTDDAEAAERAAVKVKDARVKHFHDPRKERRAGEAFAKGLIREGAGPAWDIYLFYAPGKTWDDDPPSPSAWMHQLSGGRRADPDHFHTGDELLRELHAAMKRLALEHDRKRP